MNFPLEQFLSHPPRSLSLTRYGHSLPTQPQSFASSAWSCGAFFGGDALSYRFVSWNGSSFTSYNSLHATRSKFQSLRVVISANTKSCV